MLIEYCPGGSLSPRPERSALRVIASVAAVLQYFLSLGHNAHANLSSTHVLLDARGAIKLGGFGYTRARRIATRPNLSETDDVRALTAILYELLTGNIFDPNGVVVLPDDLSPLTVNLIRSVLFVKQKFVPELTVFRYDLAAVRRFVPECAQMTRAVKGHSAVEKEEVDESHVSDGDTPSHTQSLHAVESADVDGGGVVVDDINSEVAVGIMRKSTNDDVVALAQEDVDVVVRACAKDDELPDNIFKFLFTLQISKNPIVAYKAVTLLHYLLAEGTAKLTASAITHDGFLKWAEGAWTRERIHGKLRKTNGCAQYFAEGEIAGYIGLLRKRIVVHAKFAKVLSTHWVPRVDGLTSTDTSRTEAVSAVLEIVQDCQALLRSLLRSRDPLTEMKQGAIPVIVSDLAKAYLAICWLYATADEQTKTLLNQNFARAHNTTHVTMEAVRGNPNIAVMCSSNFLLDLGKDVPVDVDLQSVTSALKKKKKKKKTKTKKSKTPLSGAEFTESEVSRRTSDFDDGERGHHATGEEMAVELSTKSRQVNDGGIADEEPDETLMQRTIRARSTIQTGSRASYAQTHEMNGSTHDNDVVGKPPRPHRNSTVLNGLQKLSLNVRRSGPRTGPVLAPRTAPRMSEPVGTSLQIRLDNGFEARERMWGTSKTLEDIPRKKISTAKRFGVLKPDSVDSNPYSPSRGFRGNGLTHVSYHGDTTARRRTMSGQDIESSESDSESSEDQGSQEKHRRKGSKPWRQKTLKQYDDSESSEEEDSEKQEKRPARVRVSNPKSHPDEKKIPFDKESSKKATVSKKPSTPGNRDTNFREGSREALAAAASGKKTPSMNPKFEVAPYEVQFGPQIGSGGFGVVFKAKFRGETVAVKKIHAHALSNINSITEFQSEVAVLCTLQHPHILRFVGACTKPPNLMIITEFMARGTLFELLHQSQTRVTWPMRKKFALDTCKGMRYLHDSKLLHRDLKSSNLMLDKDFNCKVGDFGLTRISRGTAAVQMTGQCGTFQYMAVEVLANKPYSEKADVFSFGILLWEMVARKLPYFGMQPMQVGIAVLQQGMRPPIPPKCPLPLANLMRACWDSDPNRRPSFAQLVEALEAMPE